MKAAVRSRDFGAIPLLSDRLRDLRDAPDEVVAHALRGDPAIAQACREARARLVAPMEKRLGRFDPLHLRALVEVPRERFVRISDVEGSVLDQPLPLDDIGAATISAPHAYLLSFRLLDLQPGDTLVELGSGSGYGAALASFIVGEYGRVVTIEIDETLALIARDELSGLPNVACYWGDALHSTMVWPTDSPRKVVCTFAVERIPNAWTDALRPPDLCVAPVGAQESDQRLTLLSWASGGLAASDHGAVRYVPNRSLG